MSTADEVTELLRAWASGNQQALEQLTPLVYGELRQLAASHLRRERGDHTLQPTALVHDVDSAGKHGLFRIATAGGTPERLGDFPTSIWTGNIEITPDGRKIMVSVGDYDTGYELWSLENFVPPATNP